MKCTHYKNVEETKVTFQDAKDVQLRIVIGPKDGAPNFVMRVFTVSPGGYSPRHSHDFEHAIFFQQGTGDVFFEGKLHPVGPGFVTFIPPNEEHQFLNTGNEDLVFICVVPKGI